MKIEEALALFGESPRAGQRVVDLGAAPGGWSYAFLRRGCRVTAVDRAALKLGSPDRWGGTLEHRREDGLRYRPAAAVDWLLSDMLVPPGVTLGLLRKWIGQGWTRRFIVNVKLPQKEPYAALRPLEQFLEREPGVEATLRQLHHDRREVTAWGRVRSAAPQPAARRPRRSR
jgi:23S rRNA (cytidine2498-2'-O)-methyltransferase